MSGQIILRAAEAQEAAEIAAFHVRIWRLTYREIAPAAALKKLDAAHRLPTWESTLETPKPRQHTLLAHRNAALVGLISFGPPSQPAFGSSGEIKHLYVDPSCKRQGLGQRLLRAALTQLSHDGFESAALAVAAENSLARQFYKAMGGAENGSFTDAGPLWKSDNIRVIWGLPPALTS